MSLKKTYEFNQIVEDILKHEEFLKLQHELHHGISRFEHSVRVAKMAYRMSKKLGMDYERVTRAALLHDFYTDEDTLKYNAKQTLKTRFKIDIKAFKSNVAQKFITQYPYKILINIYILLLLLKYTNNIR